MAEEIIVEEKVPIQLNVEVIKRFLSADEFGMLLGNYRKNRKRRVQDRSTTLSKELSKEEQAFLNGYLFSRDSIKTLAEKHGFNVNSGYNAAMKIATRWLYQHKDLVEQQNG